MADPTAQELHRAALTWAAAAVDGWLDFRVLGALATPPRCGRSRCTTPAAVLDPSGVGWCERHLDAGCTAIRRRPPVADIVLPEALRSDLLGLLDRLRCMCSHHGSAGDRDPHEAGCPRALYVALRLLPSVETIAARRDALADRRHGFRLRSTDWRDPDTLARVPARLHGLCADIAQVLDAIERREGPADRRGGA